MEETRQHSALDPVRTACCITGGGPAGMMLGLLLARAGVDVVVLEKHGDFLRDFRGDTVHPSTMEVMHELGILEEFLKRPHQKVRQMVLQMGSSAAPVADFSRVPARCKFIAFMQQWDFLNFLTDQAKQYEGFHLHMRTEVKGLIEQEGKVAGVYAQTSEGLREIHAQIVVGADGRDSDVRQAAGLSVENLGAPMDVLWFRISRLGSDRSEVFAHVEAGRMLVMLDRGDYWQCAYIIPKDGFETVKREGLKNLQREVAKLAPFIEDRVGEIRSWDDVKLLTVAVDRLRTWYKPGLLCIGDAAHAMSPIGGLGINLAIQDAVAAANILVEPLKSGKVTIEHLKAVQNRREFPTRLTQRIQLAAQNRLISRVLKGGEQLELPWAFRMLQRFSLLRSIPAWLAGVGVRPEHVRTPDIRVS